MNSVKRKQKKKGSKAYEIVIGILSFILVYLIFSFVLRVASDVEYDYTRKSDDLWYYMVDWQYYSPYEIYEYTAINRSLGVKPDDDMKMLYGYGDYCIDAFCYNGIINPERKEHFRQRMQQDIINMDEISGLSNRIDRILK